MAAIESRLKACESRNCLKIQICQTFECLDNNERKDVLKFIEKETKCIKSSRCLTDFLFSNSNNEFLSYASLRNIVKHTNKIANNHITNDNTQSLASMFAKICSDSCSFVSGFHASGSDSNTTDIATVKDKHSVEKKTESTHLILKSNGKNVFSLLFELPDDIIKLMAYYLNKNSIESFEQCCRRHYILINNINFVRKHTAFEQFTLSDKILTNMVNDYHRERKLDFFKYSQCKELYIEWLFCGNIINHFEYIVEIVIGLQIL